jgi:hypothetical protein
MLISVWGLTTTIRERKYQPATHEKLEKCIRWCQNYLNLRDWEIDFYTGRREQNDYSAGWTVMDETDSRHEIAEIWIDPGYCKEKDQSPYAAVCHELIHVLVMGKAKIFLEDGNDNDEIINYAFQDLLY